jgi:hypothetical protein
MKPFLHRLLFTISGLELVGTSLESLSLSAGQQNALVALLAVYIPLSHYLLGKAID